MVYNFINFIGSVSGQCRDNVGTLSSTCNGMKFLFTTVLLFYWCSGSTEWSLTLTLPSPYVGMGGSLTVTVA